MGLNDYQSIEQVHHSLGILKRDPKDSIVNHGSKEECIVSHTKRGNYENDFTFPNGLVDLDHHHPPTRYHN
ncbi:hypothetical protein A0J61_02232 [Choanephora cucurbitarum]|uniref:Uncharacterized protein n=1 Tax=Choanephora cucurbitarum TaxID=101091 RepID=A0A1C7NMM5_9FUNG|nr:hypothetical protein A0J61_02232 [Choanephora cucurbitarum]